MIIYCGLRHCSESSSSKCSPLSSRDSIVGLLLAPLEPQSNLELLFLDAQIKLLTNDWLPEIAQSAIADVKATVVADGILMHIGLITLDEGGPRGGENLRSEIALDEDGEEVKIQGRIAELIFL
ncbi:hypothetical protein E4U25_000850 [Claviceps purpurea]|nr:hypothetical protein E4U12_006809 [Claviceps purpurea]KAG6220996.1 hypothetical protein E4U25_000850 [Claviceps purpurea]